MYDKEAILEYFLKKKNEYNRKLKDYEKQKKKDEAEFIELANAEKMSKIKQFLTTEKNIVTDKVNPFKKDDESNRPNVSNMADGRDKKLPSFWIPSMTPEAKTSKIEKPVSIMCYINYLNVSY